MFVIWTEFDRGVVTVLSVHRSARSLRTAYLFLKAYYKLFLSVLDFEPPTGNFGGELARTVRNGKRPFSEFVNTQPSHDRLVVEIHPPRMVTPTSKKRKFER